MYKKIQTWTSHRSLTLHQLGFTIIRISFGIVFLIFGFNKLTSGSTYIKQLGSTLSLFGITHGYLFWGYIAALTEFCGGICYIFGFCTRVASLIFVCFFIVALRSHLHKGDPFMSWAFACICLCVVSGFLIAGSGKYSLDSLIHRAYSHYNV